MSLKNPNLKHLRACLAVARRQSISAAAEDVYMSQPAVTQAVAKVERLLGVELFDRRPEGVFVTEPGKIFVRRVERLQDYLIQATAEIMRLGRRNRGHQVKLYQLVTGVQLRALIAISEAGSFSLAARNVGVSQPSLHRAARELEQLCAVPLFEKASTGILLTKQAETFVMFAKLALVELGQAEDEIASWKGGRGGRIVIGSMPLARSAILPNAINAIMEEFPDTRLRVVDGPYQDLLFGLRHGDIDMLIGALRDPVPVDDVVQSKLFDDPLAIVGRVHHPLAKQKNITPRDLAAYGWAVPLRGAPTRDYFETMFPVEAEVRPKSIVETGSLILIRRMLSTSDKLTIISRHQIMQEEKYGELKRLPMDLPDTERPIGLTVRKGWSPTSIQQNLIERLETISQNIDTLW